MAWEIIWQNLDRKTPGPVMEIRTSGGATAIIYNDDYINKTPEEIQEAYYQRARALYKAYGLEGMMALHESVEREIEEAKKNAPRPADAETQG